MKRLDEILEGREDSYILPFLWLKGEDNDKIRREIDRISDCGIRQICVESRPHPDFAGQGWWENLDCVMEEAKKRGMRVWVLDDRKFPTGYANGAFETKHPKLSKIYLAERHVDICGPCRDGVSLVENFLAPDGELLGILACPKPDGETLAVSGDGVLDLTDRVCDGFVFYDLPPGPYRLFVFFTTRKGGGRDHYMNLLDSESVRVLLDEVYEPHYARYKSEFGKTFAGFFSDEPEIGNVPGYPFDCLPGQANIRLPWSGELFAMLRRLWGEDFRKNLPALWYEYGEKTERIRSQYMDSVTKLVYTCFSGQVGKWCRERGAEYIGHIIEDDNAHARLGCSIGHYFREMQGQDMAGIDVVHHQIVPGFTEKIHQWIAGDSDGEFFHFGLAKLGSSMAHLDAKMKNRALCEIFGNYGWAEGVSFMKWLANHMLARGINHFTPHAFSMTFPDRDCPPHFYAEGNNPQFPVFACLMRYMNRAAHFLSGEKPLRDAAILYHAESEWTGKPFMLFQKPMRALLEDQMDADIVPADLLEDAFEKDGRLWIGTESYPVLILPGCERIPEAAAKLVMRTKTLPVFAVGTVPEKDTLGRALPPAFGERLRRVSLGKLAGEVRAAARPVFETDRAFPWLRAFAVPEKDSLFAMFFNESTTEKAVLSVRLAGGPYQAVTEADLWANTAKTWKLEDNTLSLDLEPGEAAFYVFERRDGVFPEKPGRVPEQVLDLEWKVSRKRRQETDFAPVFTRMPGTPYPNMNGRDFDTGFVGTFRYEGTFTLKRAKDAEYWLGIPQAGDTARVFLNGQDLGYLAGFPGRTEITGALKDGENSLVIDVTNTLVWEIRDGASTHLQIEATGLLASPVIEKGERL